MERVAQQAARGRRDRRGRVPRHQRPRLHVALARSAATTLRRNLRVGPLSGHGLLARPNPSGHLLLPPARHRRHHQRQLRRRMDGEDHPPVRLHDGAGIDVAAMRRARRCARSGGWKRATPSASRSTDRGARPAWHSPGHCGWRRSRAIRSCRSTSRRARAGPRRAGTRRRCRCRSAASPLVFGEPIEIPRDADDAMHREPSGASWRTGSTRCSRVRWSCWNSRDSMLLISSSRFANHLTPPGHPESPERAESSTASPSARACVASTSWSRDEAHRRSAVTDTHARISRRNFCHVRQGVDARS